MDKSMNANRPNTSTKVAKHQSCFNACHVLLLRINLAASCFKGRMFGITTLTSDETLTLRHLLISLLTNFTWIKPFITDACK